MPEKALKTHIPKTLPASDNTQAFSFTNQTRPDYTKSFSPLSIQRKLTVGASNDPLEYEADAMADKVMRMPGETFVQRKCAACEEGEKEKLHRKPLSENVSFIQAKGGEGVAVNDSIASSIQSTKGTGSGLDANTYSVYEQSLWY